MTPPKLVSGARLGQYEILSPLGAGGMGEVYRARDIRLNRDVAIKVLLPAVANDPDRLARFTREAHLLASLNHPHIAQIHGLEDADGVRALIMEFVDGPTLADRIALGAIPLAEALPIARQIAEGLEAAHEQGIVHRDLKPANIKVRPDGTVKILDFGLARAADPVAASSIHALSSPTISVHATEAGIILGTAAYMSPEQASGKTVDKRTDVWAFGVVLLEMLTARRVFQGETVSHILASVLKDQPDFSALPADTPVAIRKLIRRCLEKDRKQRLADAGDARLEVEDAMSPATSEAPSPAPVSLWRLGAPWIVAAVAVAAAASPMLRSTNKTPAPLYASIDVPSGFVLGEDDQVSLPLHTPMVFTPDGRSLIIQAAVEGKPPLFLRALDRPGARPIAGTEGARAPFVSPDGKWIGFYASGEIRKVPIEGGEAATICFMRGNALGPDGAFWGNGDVILFADDGKRQIFRVGAAGGVPVPATTQAGRTRRHVTPFMLPDGKRFLFADVSSVDANDANLMVQDIGGGAPRLILTGGTDPRVLPSGQLAFIRMGTLMTAPFDISHAQTTGDAVVAMRDVMQSGTRVRGGANNTGAGMFAVSSLGALAVVRGPVAGGEDNRLVWVTRDGAHSSAEPAAGAPSGGRLVPRISPDQSRALVSVITSKRWEWWIADWARNVWTFCVECPTATAQLAKAWSSDGRSVLLDESSDALTAYTIDNSVPPRVLVREPNRVLVPAEWLPDGRIVYLAGADSLSATQFDIKVLDVNATSGRVVGTGSAPSVSPDGKWLAYDTSQGAEANVFVQAFPGPGSRIQVSAGGGGDASWSADSRTIFYVKRLTRTDVSVFAVHLGAAGLSAGTPRELFRLNGVFQTCAAVRCYDVASDGRFLFRDRESVPRSSVTRFDLVQNWTTIAQ